MLSIRDFTDQELIDHLSDSYDWLNESEYGSGDYNCASAEIEVTKQELRIRKIKYSVE